MSLIYNFVRFIIYIIPIILITISSIVPNNSNNLNLDYAVFIINNFQTEIYTLLFVIVIFEITSRLRIYNYLVELISDIFMKRKHSKNQQLIVLVILLILIIILIFLSFNLFNISKQRYKFYNSNINSVFFEKHFTIAEKFEKNRDYDKAIKNYQKIVIYFPNSFLIENIKSRISKNKSLINKSVYLYNRSNKIFETYKHITKTSLWLSADSISIYPNNKLAIKNFVIQFNQFLDSIDNIKKRIQKCTKNNKQALTKSEVILFDTIIRDNISNNICETVNTMNEEIFLESIYNAWSFKEIKDVYKKNILKRNNKQY